jgi:hypothetical protein
VLNARAHFKSFGAETKNIGASLQKAPLDGSTSFFGSRSLALPPFAFSDLLAVYRDVARRFDPDANLAAIDCHDRHFDIIANVQRLAGSPGQYEHIRLTSQQG